MPDILETLYKGQPETACLDHGFVRLVDVMPRVLPEGESSCDYAIAEAARTSYKKGTQQVSSDRDLIRYLMRHQHTTPFEMVEFKFHCKMPIFVARQWIRHRTASVNEQSARYSQMTDEFYLPELENVRTQSQINKQCSDGQLREGLAQQILEELKEYNSQTYQAYQNYLEEGMAREQARMILPSNVYTEWYWKIDLHNLLHFLALRCDPHAQQEIRVYADAMVDLITPVVPLTMEAWNAYHSLRNAVTLTGLEVEAIKDYLKTQDNTPAPAIDTANKREQAEWKDKAKKLGFTV